MNAIIPVAGRGKRLRPHTHTQPKVLMNVAGKPILAYILDELRVLGVEEIVLVVGHLAEKIEEYVRERYPFRAHFVRQEEPMGNGHAVYLARQYLATPTLIVFGDTIFQADLRAGRGSRTRRSACTGSGTHVRSASWSSMVTASCSTCGRSRRSPRATWRPWAST